MEDDDGDEQTDGGIKVESPVALGTVVEENVSRSPDLPLRRLTTRSQDQQR
jgi:hypothetical protein